MANTSLGPKQIDITHLGAISVALDHRIKGASLHILRTFCSVGVLENL